MITVCPVLIHMMFVMIIKVMFVIMMDILGSLKKESSLIDLTSVDEDQGKLHSGIRCQVPVVMLNGQSKCEKNPLGLKAITRNTDQWSFPHLRLGLSEYSPINLELGAIGDHLAKAIFSSKRSACKITVSVLSFTTSILSSMSMLPATLQCQCYPWQQTRISKIIVSASVLSLVSRSHICTMMISVIMISPIHQRQRSHISYLIYIYSSYISPIYLRQTPLRRRRREEFSVE